MKKVSLLVAVITLGIPTTAVAETTLPTNYAVVQASKKKKASKTKVSAKQATTNKKLAKYLKTTKNAGYLVQTVKTVSGVPTIIVNDVTSLNKPVFYEYMAQIIGNAKKTPMTFKGIGIVQQNEYRNASGKKKNLMEFSFFFNSNTLNQLSFSSWGQIVYKNPKSFYNEATGYYLMSDFVKDSKNRRPNSNLMKADDGNIIASYMDKFGTD
ncbi:hypothetical protein KTT66_03245 [Lacticaseibacillus casei]|jgi:hypothetical protein|uniref:Uncharacterized protein n=1 Tax=Lacticaseibacillus huelsenbergensis TaxID=3035291 RepID=A0ABY8DNW4_9LACO|nr:MULTISPECIES: hypothetical protein [Lacticaseibacillus]MDG3061865.1 hypothetical protein [Lacticaseibacillus sp. BCRC 81376]QVI38068.1 hypothetical protein KGS74_03560 [Lacticaseibacillus casei]QXG59853.1 hypothetical protein KTT66_03245 [Lacticaseibacillus casei]WFB38674.1 hypothetical protein LHUE1_002212 [Lacticaseibacillus huelsenbergensis]WFB43069.1 hypothetical protein LHUE2_001134 [Lacticaseibacillus huelsenbergensis]